MEKYSGNWQETPAVPKLYQSDSLNVCEHKKTG